MPGNARGVSQLKSLSAVQAFRSTDRHVHQFQIASLELENSRRARERQDAVNRIKSLDTRLLEIEALIRRHQDALSVTSPDGTVRAEPTPARKPAAPAANQKRRTLRY